MYTNSSPTEPSRLEAKIKLKSKTWPIYKLPKTSRVPCSLSAPHRPPPARPQPSTCLRTLIYNVLVHLHLLDTRPAWKLLFLRAEDVHAGVAVIKAKIESGRDAYDQGLYWLLMHRLEAHFRGRMDEVRRVMEEREREKERVRRQEWERRDEEERKRKTEQIERLRMDIRALLERRKKEKAEQAVKKEGVGEDEIVEEGSGTVVRRVKKQTVLASTRTESVEGSDTRHQRFPTLL